MSALVSYASSDGEEDDDDVQPEKPAKIAKLGEDHGALQSANATINTRSGVQAAPTINEPAEPPRAQTSKASNSDTDPLLGPAQGPSIPPPSTPFAPATTTSTPSSPPPSPYTLARLQTRSLTLPPNPNFHIPPSPSPPAPGTPAHATLLATTKKFTRFLELKAQGVHFNARLLGSVALRNPGVGSQLMDFAGVEGYVCAIGVEGVGVPGKWMEECYVEALVEGNERRERKRLAGRGGVEFVPPTGGGGGSTPTAAGVNVTREESGSVSGSAAGTPAGGGGGGKKRGVGKR